RGRPDLLPLPLAGRRSPVAHQPEEPVVSRGAAPERGTVGEYREAPVRICLVAQEYPPDTARGGIGTQTWNKARWLTRLGHQMHVLSASASRSTDVETRVEDDVTVHRLPPPSLGLALYQPETYWLGYSWAVFGELRRLVERVGFDLIDFPEYGGEGFVYLLDRTVWDWIPVVVQLHGPLSMFAERIGWPEPSSVFAQIGSMMEE